MVPEILDPETGEFICYDVSQSILASIGQLIQPIFTPLGFGSQLNKFGWVFAVAAICLHIRALWSLRHEMQRGARVADVMSAIAVAAILAWVIAVLVSGL